MSIVRANGTAYKFSVTESIAERRGWVKKLQKQQPMCMLNLIGISEAGTEPKTGVRMLWICASNLDRLWFQMAKRQITSSLKFLNV